MSQVVFPHSGPGVLPLESRISTATWTRIATLSILVAAVFWSSLWRLWSKTNLFYGEGNWAHSTFVPIIGLYYLYLNREDLFRAQIRPILLGGLDKTRLIPAILALAVGTLCRMILPQFMTGSGQTFLTVGGTGLLIFGALLLLLNWGIGSLVFGLLTFAYGIWPGQNDFVKDIGFVITLFGIVLTLCGWQVMKVAWFPIAFIICALPWPPLVYSWVAGPLQQLAAMFAVLALNVTGVAAEQQGTKIHIPTGIPSTPFRTLNVAEACAGMRSLMTFITLGAAIGFLSNRPLWQRIVITASAIPIAVLCNVARVAGQGIIDTYVSHDFAEGFAHQFVGLVMMIPAFFLLMGVGWLVDQIFVEEIDPAVAAASVNRIVRKPRPAQPAQQTASQDAHREGAHS